MADMVRRFREWDPEVESRRDAATEGEATLARGLGNAQAPQAAHSDTAGTSSLNDEVGVAGPYCTGRAILPSLPSPGLYQPGFTPEGMFYMQGRGRSAPAEEGGVESLAAAVLQRSRNLLKERDVIQQRIQAALAKYSSVTGGSGAGAGTSSSGANAPGTGRRQSPSPEKPAVVREPGAMAAGLDRFGARLGAEVRLAGQLEGERPAIASPRGAERTPPPARASGGGDGPAGYGSQERPKSSGISVRQAPWRERLVGIPAARACISASFVPITVRFLGCLRDSRHMPLPGVLQRALLAQAGVEPGPATSPGPAVAAVATGAGTAGANAATGSPSLLRQADAGAPEDPLEAWRKRRQRQQQQPENAVSWGLGDCPSQRSARASGWLTACHQSAGACWQRRSWRAPAGAVWRTRRPGRLAGAGVRLRATSHHRRQGTVELPAQLSPIRWRQACIICSTCSSTSRAPSERRAGGISSS